MNAVFQRLGNYVNIQTGKLDANASSTDGEYPFFTCSREPLKIDTYAFDCECVLVAGNGDLNVKYYSGKFNAYQRTYVVGSKDSQRLNTRYLHHFLDSSLEGLRNQSIGGVIKYIKLGNLTELQIPLPPLEEQKRIAGILDKADAIRRKRAESLKLLDELLRATFLDMFGDPITNPKGWPIMSMEDVANKITDGEHLNPSFVNDGVPMVMANNVRTMGIVFDDVKFVSHQDYAKFSRKCRPQSEDLLLVSRGATIGRSCLVNTHREFCLMGSVILIKPNVTKILSEYIGGCFSQENFVKKLTKTSGSSAQQAIYLKDLKNVKLPIPPTDLQKNFSAIYQKVLSDKNKHFEAQSESDTLFNSLVARAFKGEL